MKTKGYKKDSEKTQFEYLPFDAISEIAKVMTYGANKYEPRNWERGMSWSRVFNALHRHLSLWFQGEDLDDETNLSHLAHAGCCLLFILAYELREDGIDDRPKLSEKTLNKMKQYINTPNK